MPPRHHCAAAGVHRLPVGTQTLTLPALTYAFTVEHARLPAVLGSSSFWVLFAILLLAELRPLRIDHRVGGGMIALGTMFAVALLLGYLVSFHLDYLLGLLAFVSVEIHSIDWAFHATSRFFSGQFVPLWLFPGALGVLADVLPFRSIFFIPLSIYTGALRGKEIPQALSFQLLWTIILLILSRWLWDRIQTRIISQGG